jgi:hypothetical protein
MFCLPSETAIFTPGVCDVLSTEKGIETGREGGFAPPQASVAGTERIAAIRGTRTAHDAQRFAGHQRISGVEQRRAKG